MQFLQPQGGYTALLRAAESGRAECVRLLVEAGASIEYKDCVRDVIHLFVFSSVPRRTDFLTALVSKNCVLVFIGWFVNTNSRGAANVISRINARCEKLYFLFYDIAQYMHVFTKRSETTLH